MKSVMVRPHMFAMLTSKCVIISLFAALLTVAPFQAAQAQTVPDLGAAESFAALAGTALTLTNSTVVGDVGVSTGTAPTLTTSTVVGTIYEGNPITTDAGKDFNSAYDSLAADSVCTASLDAVYTTAAITLAPGVYCNSGAVTLTGTTFTLDAQGDPNAVWIFKIGTLGTGALTGTGFTVAMANGGQPCNVYWWVAQAVTMTTSNIKGTLLVGTAATFGGGSLAGRTLAQAGITMTGTDIIACTILEPPPPVEDCKEFCKTSSYCKEYWKMYWKKHWTEYWKDYWHKYFWHSCKHKSKCHHMDKHR